MSFRGRHPTKFRRSGNLRGHERPSFRERGRPFKRKYHEDRASPSLERFQEYESRRGRQISVGRERDDSDRGGGRPFKKFFRTRPWSRGRYFRGGRGHYYRGSRGRRPDSPREFDRERSLEKYKSHIDDWPEESEFVEDEGLIDRRAGAHEWYKDDEVYNSGEECDVPLERGLRSPLTIHRIFGSEEFDQSSPRSPVRRSRSHLRRSPSFERFRSPVERLQRFEGRRYSTEHERSVSIERRGHFIESRRSLGIDRRDQFVEHQRPNSPVERLRREGRKRSLDFNRHSFNRSLSPPRTYKSRERSFRGSDRERSRERSAGRSTRRSIERQIAIERARLHEMLEHEKKLLGKRSESSIERLLEDCKKSFGNNIKSASISRSNSFEKEIDLRRKNEKSSSPFDQPRKFKGLGNITIKRGRSLERSNSPVGSQSRVEFSPIRQRSPGWKESYREMYEDITDSGRKSRSPIHQRKQYLSRDLSPGILYDVKPEMSNVTLTKTFQESAGFLGEQGRPFLGKQEGPFLGDRVGPFLRDQEGGFLGEQGRPFLDEKSYSIESTRRSYIHSSLDNQEKPFPSSSHTRIFKGRGNFLGVGDGPLLENRPISKDKKECDNYNKKEHGKLGSKSRQDTSPIPQPKSSNGEEICKTKRFKGNLELSPVSQPGRFQRREFTDYEDVRPDSRMDLSPISHTGSFEQREFSQEIKHDELSPISQSESFGKELLDENVKNSNSGIKRSGSEDSMQKFLAELEHDDISTSSNGISSHLKEKDQAFEDVWDRHSGEKRKQCILVKEDYKLNREPNDSNISKGKDNSEKSYYNFNLSYESKLNKKCDKPSNKNKEQDELFNAYEKSFMNQTCDPYNENIFQGRYEQSANKFENKPSKMDAKICLRNEIPVPSSHINKTELSALNVPPFAQQISTKPQSYQSSDKNCTQIPPYPKPANQNLLNPSIIFSGNNIRPGITPSFHNQVIRPTFPFHQTPLPVIPPITVQRSALLPNQSIQNLQRPKSLMSWADPMFSRRDGEIFGKQNVNWQNQSTGFQSNTPEKFNHSSYHAQSSNRGQVPFNQTISQTGTMPLNPMCQNRYPNPNTQLSGKPLSSNVLPADQRANEFQPFPAWSGPKWVLANTLSGGNSMKTSHVQHNVKEVIVIDDGDEINKNYNDDEQLVYKSGDVIIPTAKVVEKYKNCPPTYDVLGTILNGFVIYFGIKTNSELQRDPLEVLKESFSSSEGFAGLDIEEKSEYKSSCSQPMQVCELRWKGLLLSRAEGESSQEVQQAAGVALINTLAKTCYSIKTNTEYYNKGRLPKFMLKEPHRRGYYKMVERDEIIKSVTETVKHLRAQGFAKGVDATHVNAVTSFMDEFFKDQETHCELIFGPTSGMEYTLNELQTIDKHARGKGLQCRWFKGAKKVKVLGKFLGVSRHFSPQALKRYLLAEKGDTVRYRLHPPQGPKIDLLNPRGRFNPKMIISIVGKPLSEISHRDCPHSQGHCHCDHRLNPPKPPAWRPTGDHSHRSNQPKPPGLDWGPTGDQSPLTNQPKPPGLDWGPTDDHSHRTNQPKPPGLDWGPTSDQTHRTNQPKPPGLD